MLRFNPNVVGDRKSDHYATPKKFFAKLDFEFQFDLDPCPLTSPFDGLVIPWKGNIYINPPYSNILPWVEKAVEELKNGNAKKCVLLIPVRSDVIYWHDTILRYASEIRLVRGRLHFNDSVSPAPFPCALVVFD